MQVGATGGAGVALRRFDAGDKVIDARDAGGAGAGHLGHGGGGRGAGHLGHVGHVVGAGQLGQGGISHMALVFSI